MTKTAAVYDFEAIGKTLAPARPDLPALLRAPRVHACRWCSTEPFNAAAVDDIPSLWHHRQKLVRIAEKADELIPSDPEGGSASEVMAIWDRAFAIDEIISAVRARCIHEAEAQTALLADLVDAEWDANQGRLRDSILAVIQSLSGEAHETAGGASTEPQPALIDDVEVLAKFREGARRPGTLRLLAKISHPRPPTARLALRPTKLKITSSRPQPPGQSGSRSRYFCDKRRAPAPPSRWRPVQALCSCQRRTRRPCRRRGGMLLRDAVRFLPELAPLCAAVIEPEAQP